jgi:hypothetical protein
VAQRGRVAAAASRLPDYPAWDITNDLDAIAGEIAQSWIARLIPNPAQPEPNGNGETPPETAC